jgi:hypothetical protein
MREQMLTPPEEDKCHRRSKTCPSIHLIWSRSTDHKVANIESQRIGLKKLRKAKSFYIRFSLESLIKSWSNRNRSEAQLNYAEALRSEPQVYFDPWGIIPAEVFGLEIFPGESAFRQLGETSWHRNGVA